MRDPEDQAAIDSHMHLDIEQLPFAFLDSAEFRESVAKPVLAGSTPPFLSQPVGEPLAAWNSAFFGTPIDAQHPLRLLLAASLRRVTETKGANPRRRLLDKLAARLSDGDVASADPVRSSWIEALLTGRAAKSVGATAQALLAAEAPRRPRSGRLPATGAQPSSESRPTRSDRALIEASGLWDPAFYGRQKPHLGSQSDLLADYLRHGAREGLDPHPLFSGAQYALECLDSAEGLGNPLLHYLHHGHLEGRSPNSLFNPDWYRRTHLNGSVSVEPLGHYAREGSPRRLQPHPLFDRDYYERLNPDVLTSGIDTYEHYIRYGNAEGRQPSDFSKSAKGLRVAVVAHVFYGELWPQLFTKIANIPGAFDTIITTPPHSGDLSEVVLKDLPAARIIELPNSGRDIAPLIHILPGLISRRYDAVCKIHTKRGLTEPETWRHLLLESVLGSETLVQNILAWFSADDRLALVGATDFYLDGPKFSQSNSKSLRNLLSTAYSPAVKEPPLWGFFAGSMFWMRPDRFKNLARLSDGQLLGDVNVANDGQAVHAAERLFGLIPTLESDRIGLVDISGASAAPVLQVSRAPGPLATRELAEYLPARRRELAAAIPELRKPSRRSWLIPGGATPGVNLIAPVAVVNGLGVSSRGYYAALKASSLGVNVIPWTMGFEHLRQEDFSFPKSVNQPINLIHLNLDFLTGVRLLDIEPLRTLASTRHFNIAIVYWELSSVHPGWKDVMDRFDEIWVSSRFMARAIGAVTAVPVRVVRPALSLSSVTGSDIGSAGKIAPGRFLFAYGADSGSIMKRKNPQALWRAYAEAFTPDDGAALAIKLHYPDSADPLVQEIETLSREREDVIYISKSLTRPEMDAFFARTDCYVSPHRSEGLGLTILEAMQAGKPVIATAYGGAADFVTPETSSVIRHRLTEVGPGADPYPAGAVWADPEPSAIVARLRDVFGDRSAAAARAEQARRVCHDLFGLDATAAAIRREVKRVWLQAGGDERAFGPGDHKRRAGA